MKVVAQVLEAEDDVLTLTSRKQLHVFHVAADDPDGVDFACDVAEREGASRVRVFIHPSPERTTS
jgi:hypothetical protein